MLCLASLLFVYRVQILSHGEWLAGDVLDARITLAIEQHWFNVFRGLETWNQPLYLVPAPDVLGYNDGYLLFGVFFSVFRLLGLDIFLSGEATAAVFRVVGFASIVVLGRRFLRLPSSAALLAAVLATVSNAMYIQSAHVQLLSVALAPLLALLLCQVARDLDRTWRCIAWSCLAAALFDAWLLTAFYTAWFTVFFAALSALAVGPKRALTALKRHPPGRRSIRWAPAAVVLVAGAVPFVLVYAPKATETGMHPFAELLAYTPSAVDLVHVGPGSLLFGPFDRWLTALIRPGFPGISEHTIGLPPPLLALAVTGAVTTIVRSGRWRPFAIAFLVSLVLPLHAGRFSPWWLVYEAVPGAGAVRVVSRFMLFLQPVAALFAVWWLAEVARSGWRVPAVALAVLLVAEEATADGSFELNRSAEMRFLAAVPPPPPECRAFYVQTPRPEYAEGGVNYQPLAVNVDGMLLAELLHLPTFNGHASFLPAGFDFGFGDLASYRAAARMRVLSSDAADVCGLDLAQDKWEPSPFAIASVSLSHDVSFGAGGDGAGLLLRGWSEQEAAGRWSVGHDVRLLMRVEAPAGGLMLTIDTWAFAGRGAPGAIEVFANDAPIATWQPTGARERLTAFIPAALVPPNGVLELRLFIARPTSPRDAGQGNDARLLGVFLEMIRLTPASR